MSRFRGGGSWARPENALKRAEELIGVGQKAAALQSLRDVITSKRSRANWSKTYEDIMFKLMDLCVEMKRRNDAKEALMQYRNMCQQVNINSLEEVIKYYLNKATEMAEQARVQAEVRLRAEVACAGVPPPARCGSAIRSSSWCKRQRKCPAVAAIHDCTLSMMKAARVQSAATLALQQLCARTTARPRLLRLSPALPRPQATSLDTVEDLEEDAKPEDLMLSYVSGDKSKVGVADRCGGPM